MRDTQLPADFTVTVPPSMQLMDYLRIGKVYPVSESGTDKHREFKCGKLQGLCPRCARSKLTSTHSS